MTRRRESDPSKGRRFISVGGPFQDTRASLCVYSKRIDLDRLTHSIGCRPSKSHERGEVPSGLRAPSRIGMWCLEAPRSMKFEAQLEYLLKKTTASSATWKRIVKSHDVQLRCAFFLRSWSEGVDLPGTMIGEIGRRHWSLGFTAYSAGGEEILTGLLRRRRRPSKLRPRRSTRTTARPAG